GQQGSRVPPVKLERYFLSYHRKLYDTWGLYSGLADGDLAGADVIPLPLGGRAPVAPVPQGDAPPKGDASTSTGRAVRPQRRLRSVKPATASTDNAPAA